MHFSKLKLSGFKSFVDPVELVIDQGITGIVGPNGCGKSNVIEALRWVMGETSAKRMRGGEMDDVIFGGSSQRPARNIAEVTLSLDNGEGGAPSPYDTLPELEITRRIERGAGSNYRINGKEVRARDVQLLFADLATGANSTAIVSQGRIGAIIGAKPTERRTLLEEAAGIRGLHSRRHEAELRLKGAEANLERLEDVIGALEAQHQGLQKQARQTNRYRRLSDHIRRHEAILLHLRWQEAKAAMAAARDRLTAAEEVVRARAEETASSTRRQADAATALPELRKADAEAAAALQALQLAMRDLENEENRVNAAREALDAQLAQIAADREREDALVVDARSARDRLNAEQTEIEAALAAEADALAAAETTASDAAQTVEEKEEELSNLTEEVAGVEAQRNALTRRVAENRQRIEQLDARLQKLAENEAALRGQGESLGEIEAAEQRIQEAEAAIEGARTENEAAEALLADRRQAETEARGALSSAEAGLRSTFEEVQRNGRERIATVERETREEVDALDKAFRALDAEMSALTSLLASGTDADEADYPPVIDGLQVTPGYETALGAAFGEELDASTDSHAPIHWTDLPPLGGSMGLPSGAEPLTKFVDGPKALSRVLSQIGVVADAAAGRKLQGDLGPGQRLVSRDGGLWRWDGYTITAGTPTAAARRLEQKNRLADLREEHAATERKLTAARENAEARVTAVKAEVEAETGAARADMETKLSAAREAAAQASAAAEEATRSARQAAQALQTAFNTLNGARQAHAALAGKAADLRSRLEGIEENRRQAEQERADTEDELRASESAIAVLEDPVAARERVNRLRAAVAELRTDLLNKRGAFDLMQREAAGRRQRLQAIETERASWEQRVGGAETRVTDLETRQARAEEERAALEGRPAEIESQRARLNDQILMAQATRRAAGDALAVGEQEQAEADKALRAAEAALATAREGRVRRESEVDQARQVSDTVVERIRETLDCAPDAALAAGGVAEDEELPPRADVESRLERLVRERDNMGPVNLRAEQEAEELSEQITSMHSEREDLLAAIARLRQGINALNREGRERLLAAFEQVNSHFTDLFTRLFGGGEAKLTLTEADDPLEAGLEIMASPPGKRMQIMSLLSGGEQALTALALLFGVFLTNPAPICVLDEVDAPLDDSNVDRFCTLLDEIAHTGKTRFLVVTHHRLTMARVDRLFGVTMAERGISQLVSVDLREAARLRETA